jgi:hypothetical protein
MPPGTVPGWSIALPIDYLEGIQFSDRELDGLGATA